MVTENLPTAACPKPAQLAEYVEGLLTGDARARVEAHLADCDVCREVVAEAVRMRGDAASAKVLPFWKQSRVRVGGGILALAAALWLVVRVQPQWNPLHRPMPYEELVAAVGTNRTVEGRLTGGFQYGALRTPTRSGRAGAQDHSVLAAAAGIQKRSSDNPSAENLHALGVSQLILGNVDEGLTNLTHAGRLDQRPGFLSDLGVAYLERGKTEHRQEDYAEALTLFDKALASDPRFAEAKYNRAIALEALGRSTDARGAWIEFLADDQASEWARDAQRRLERLP